MRCFPALERTRTPEKDISFKNIGLILLSQGDADITVVPSELSQMITGPNLFGTTEEDLSGTTATKGKVAEIATESVTTFDRILIGAQEVRATPERPGMRPITVEWDPIGLHSGNRLFVTYAQLSPLPRKMRNTGCLRQK